MLRCSQQWRRPSMLRTRNGRCTATRSISGTPNTGPKQSFVQRWTRSGTSNWPSTAHYGRGMLNVFTGIVTLHAFLGYGYTFTPAYGISMVPTMASAGEWVIIDKYYRRGRGLRVGDLVSFKSPVREGEFAIKRIIGLSGDYVSMNTPGKSDAMIQVPEGHCWVVGDNLPHSRDSRIWGPLPMALICGKVTIKCTWWDWMTLPRNWTLVENTLQPAVGGYDDD